MGWFEGRRVELVEGEVIEMGKQSEWHVVVCAVVVRVLAATFGPAFWVRWPSPIDAGGISEPEPDAAVVPGRPQDYAKSLADGHPSQPLLVVEVAVTSLNYDRTVKGSLYAKAGIAEYWIVDVVGKRLEVHRKPGPAAAAKYGFAYAETQVLAPADAVSPLARPEAKVAVADLLA
jgi:Uma2 family endonuclease